MNKDFKFYDLLRNSDGKFSNSGFTGFVIAMVGALSFIAAMVGWFIGVPDVIEVMESIVYLIAISGGVLGIRKVVGFSKGNAQAINYEVNNKNIENNSQNIPPVG